MGPVCVSPFLRQYTSYMCVTLPKTLLCLCVSHPSLTLHVPVYAAGDDVALSGAGAGVRRRVADLHPLPQGRETSGGKVQTLRPSAGLRSPLPPRAGRGAQVRPPLCCLVLLLSCLGLYCPVLSCGVLFCLVLQRSSCCFVLLCLTLSCPGLSSGVLFCVALQSHVWICLSLSCPLL